MIEEFDDKLIITWNNNNNKCVVVEKEIGHPSPLVEHLAE